MNRRNFIKNLGIGFAGIFAASLGLPVLKKANAALPMKVKSDFEPVPTGGGFIIPDPSVPHIDTYELDTLKQATISAYVG